jgi:SIR2-like domain
MDSLWAGRLVIFCGAGLSMGAPSSVPSAARLADQCATYYEESSGTALPPDMHWNIELLADHFAGRRMLESIFLSDVMLRIPDFGTFFRDPNPGHEAIADLLGCSAIEMNISTNVDDLIECAAEQMWEPKAHVAVTRAETARPYPHALHVKLHGCFRRDVPGTLWSKEQLGYAPFQERIRDFSQWLPGVLQDKDLVFVGFWSDWSYLNEVLGSVIRNSQVSRIVLVNPSSEDDLRGKAGDLWDLAHQGAVDFIHERESGPVFLDELRQAYSFHFMRRLISSGRLTFTQMTGRQAPAFRGFDGLSSRDLYEWRQDSTGTPAQQIVRKKFPDENMQRLGAMHLEMQEAGAIVDGSAYVRDGYRVRLIHGAGRLVGEVRAKYAPLPSFIPDDLVVCVGADNTGFLPDNIARGNRSDSLVRPGLSGNWMTETEAREFFQAFGAESGDLPLAAAGED